MAKINARTVALVLVTALSTACASTPEATSPGEVGECRFADYQVRAIDRARELWTKALGGQSLPEPAVVCVTSDTDLGQDPRSIAFTVDKKTIFVAVDRLGLASLSLVMTHEIGHAYGLGHRDGTPLMHPKYGASYRCIDSASLDLVADRNRLDRSLMSPKCL